MILSNFKFILFVFSHLKAWFITIFIFTSFFLIMASLADSLRDFSLTDFSQHFLTVFFISGVFSIPFFLCAIIASLFIWNYISHYPRLSQSSGFICAPLVLIVFNLGTDVSNILIIGTAGIIYSYIFCRCILKKLDIEKDKKLS